MIQVNQEDRAFPLLLILGIDVTFSIRFAACRCRNEYLCLNSFSPSSRKKDLRPGIMVCAGHGFQIAFMLEAD